MSRSENRFALFRDMLVGRHRLPIGGDDLLGISLGLHDAAFEPDHAGTDSVMKSRSCETISDVPRLAKSVI